jgi:tyrosyl-tRNA synthetase
VDIINLKIVDYNPLVKLTFWTITISFVDMIENFKYDFQTLKEAILYNAKEVLPTDPQQLDKEIQFLVENANRSGEKIRHYIGFEISGQIHIGGGFFPMLQAAKLQQAGVEIVIWIADYHTWLNNKLDGKLETIKSIAREYFGPLMEQCFLLAGGDISQLKILYNFDDYRLLKQDQSFWDYEFQVDKNLTLNRVLRSMSIMGREAGDDVEYQMTRYPGMQCADVFWLQTHICQGGMDQRKIYVSARDLAFSLDLEYQLKINKKPVKPITIMGPLLLGLLSPETDGHGNLTVAKMSKSKPDSAIWVHDSAEEIFRKLKKAYCPTEFELKELNPILNWCKNMIFVTGRNVEVQRPEKFGGNKLFTDYQSLEDDFYNSSLHPMDLKTSIANNLIDWFSPIRDWLDENQQGFIKLTSLNK